MNVENYSEQVVRTHVLSSESHPYERVPKILRFSFNNPYYNIISTRWKVCKCLFLAFLVLKKISFGHIRVKMYRF